MFCLCAIKAEDLPCFDLGFQFLMLEKTKRVIDSWIKFQLKITSEVCTCLSEQVVRHMQRRKTTKSSTTWAVKVFKGMKKRKKTNYFVTNERNHCELKQRKFVYVRKKIGQLEKTQFFYSTNKHRVLYDLRQINVLRTLVQDVTKQSNAVTSNE